LSSLTLVEVAYRFSCYGFATAVASVERALGFFFFSWCCFSLSPPPDCSSYHGFDEDRRLYCNTDSFICVFWLKFRCADPCWPQVISLSLDSPFLSFLPPLVVFFVSSICTSTLIPPSHSIVFWTLEFLYAPFRFPSLSQVLTPEVLVLFLSKTPPPLATPS